MHIQRFQWTEWNLEHIARHHVTPDEVEEIAFDDEPHIRKFGETRYLYGKTITGRHLFTVYIPRGKGEVWVVTSRDMNSRERRLYQKAKKRSAL